MANDPELVAKVRAGIQSMSEEKIAATVAFYLKNYFGDDLEYSDATKISNRFANAFGSHLSLNLRSALPALVDFCRENEADSEDTAVELGDDIRLFVCGTEYPSICLIDGDRRFFMAEQLIKEAFIKTLIAEWLPDAPAVEDVASIPETFEEFREFAQQFRGYALPSDHRSLESIIENFTDGGHTSHSYVPAVFASHFQHYEGEDYQVAESRSDAGCLFRASESLQKAIAATGLDIELAEMIPFSTASDAVSQKLVYDDGGWPGERCQQVYRQTLEHGVLAIARAYAEEFKTNYDLMIEFGFVWPDKRLKYADTDCRCFAAPPREGNKFGTVHENIDLCTDPNNFLIIGTMDQHGDVTKLEIHEIATSDGHFYIRPGEFEAEPARLRQMVNCALETFEDPEGGLLNQEQFCQRLFMGDELPAPSLSLDLESGQVDIRPRNHSSGILDYFHHIANHDARILTAMKNGGHLGVGVVSTPNFGMSDEEDWSLDEKLNVPSSRGPQNQ